MFVRINKLLSERGVCSRREADRLTDAGRVTIDDKVVSTGQKVPTDACICIDGRKTGNDTEKILIAYNKPAGVVCTTTDRYGEKDIVSAVGIDKRIYPVGRLDKESTGLIFLTNQGALMNELTNAGGQHEKEYAVKINKPVTEDFLDRIRGGIYLKELDRTTAKCKAWPCSHEQEKSIFGLTSKERTFKTGKIIDHPSDKHESDYATHSFMIVLTQGLNRQIRRMCEACGARVTKLKRLRIMNVKLGELREGEYRYITGNEYDALLKELGMIRKDA